jgi:hypothetical protein
MKVKFVATIAHRPKVYSVTITGDKRPFNKKNDSFSSQHYYISLRDAKMQCSCGCTIESLPLIKGSIAVPLANACKARFKTNNCGRTASFTIKIFKTFTKFLCKATFLGRPIIIERQDKNIGPFHIKVDGMGLSPEN